MLLNKYKNYIGFLFVVLILQLSFNYNFFNSASDRFFENHQKDSETLVIGKIIDSKNNGIFNNQVLGRYSGKIQENYDLYLNDNIPTNKISQYQSSFGFQGYLYSSIDKIISIFDLTSKSKLEIMYFITSLAMSLTFAIFILLARNEFGLFSAIVLFLGVIYSQWLVVFAKNLYWMSFLLFIPFVYCWFSLKKEENNNLQELSKSFYLIVFLIIYIKSLAGFEYLSTIFISISIPFLYFYFKNSWSFNKLFKRLVFVYISAFIAFIASIFTFLIQKYFIFGSFDKAIDTLKMIVLKRTYGNPDEVHEVYRKSLESNVGEVILKYWNGKAFDLQAIFGKFTFITFGEIISVFIIFIVIFVILNSTNKLKNIFEKEQKALLFSGIIASLAPLSWYVLAKGHSYIHTTMNHILWYSPFLLLVFVFIGLTLGRLKINFKQILSFFIIVFIIYFIYSNNQRNKNIQLLNTNNISISSLESDLNIIINTKEQKIVYFYKDCKNKDITTTFFLHLVPEDINSLPENRKKYAFDNLDFSWISQALETPFFGEYKNSCIATKDLPKYKIKTIRTGQFNKDGRLWQTSIDLNSKIDKQKELQSFNFSDKNWANGISLSKSGFFVENNFLNRQSLSIGDKLKFNFSDERTIADLQYSSQYINIFVDGEKLDPIKDGYPNKILILGDK